MTARSIALAIAVTACVAVAGWRVAQWQARARGMIAPDVYPQSVARIPAGSYVLRRPPGTWRQWVLAPGTAPAQGLDIRMVFAPETPGQDTSRYDATLVRPRSDAGDRRVVVLAETPAGEAWKARAAALAGNGRWCLVVAPPRGEALDDSLILLFTAAVQGIE